MAKRSIIVRSKFHHTHGAKRNGEKDSPMRQSKHTLSSNVIFLKRPRTRINDVVVYGAVRSFSRPHKLAHSVVKIGRKWTCTCERNSLGRAICRHIRLARVEMAVRNRKTGR